MRPHRPVCCAFLLVVTALASKALADPIVWDQRVLTDKDKAVTLTLTGLETGSGTLAFSVATPPTKGKLGAITASGSNEAKVEYTPDASFTGLDAFTFRATNSASKAAAATAVILVGMAAEPGVLSPNKPQFPLKTASRLYTAEQIQQARTLCTTDTDAAGLLKSLKSNAEYWIGKTDQELRDLLPDWRVPRAFNDSVKGCPEHGEDIYAYGTYPWKLDREHPFTITCPVGGEVYPSNDFAAYYKSGFSNHALLTGQYVDPGRGWLGTDGEKRWMVAYAVHWNWRNTWIPAVTTLAQTYVLTGDVLYAEKALAMLDRIAEIYPNMIHAIQSRFGELRNGTYKGKLVNAIWETGILRELAIDYDLVFPALLGDNAVNLPWRTAAEIRANIEANLLEEGIDSVPTGEIRGNFGMHQSALIYSAVVRESTGQTSVLQDLFSATGGDQADEGLNYAFHNFVRKDGIAFENGLGYSFLWVDSFAQLAKPLEVAGTDLYEEAKFRAMLESPLSLVAIGSFTPAAGDSGSISTKINLPGKSTYKAAFRALNTAAMAYAWKTAASDGKLKDYESFDDLFYAPTAAQATALAETYVPADKTRFLDGYGLSVLNNQSNSLGLSFFYGAWGSHYHYDRLGVEVFGAGRRLSPDLGYPDFMNAYVPGIYTWSLHTVSHNTLLVDDQRQTENLDAPLVRVHRSQELQIVDTAEHAANAYKQCDVYRRTLVLRETGPKDGYVVDVFRVRGGTKSYNLSFHAQEAEFSLTGATLPSPVTEGTLAGSGVELGEIYDDPVLGAPGYSGGYTGYKGSGFQHFFNWQKVAPTGVVVADWKLTGTPEASLKLHLMPSSGQEVIVADAYVSPTKKIPTILKYVLVRRTPALQGDVFVTVWEPLSTAAQIDHVEELKDPSFGEGVDRTVGLKVVRKDGRTDSLFIASKEGKQYQLPGVVSTDASLALLSELNNKSTLVATGGSSAKLGSATLTLPGTLRGSIESVDYPSKTISVNGKDLTPSLLKGKAIRIYNDLHSAMYWIGEATAQGTGVAIQLVGSEVITGRLLLKDLETASPSVTTTTSLIGPATKAGLHLLNKEQKSPLLIESVSNKTNGVHTLGLAKGSALAGYTSGQDGWLSDVGPGDKIEVELLYEPASAQTDGGLDGSTDGDASGKSDALSSSDSKGDGATPASAGPAAGGDDSGCSCRTAGRDKGPQSGWLNALGLLSLLAGVRRSRRGSEER